jgi:hypothetical protein
MVQPPEERKMRVAQKLVWYTSARETIGFYAARPAALGRGASAGGACSVIASPPRPANRTVKGCPANRHPRSCGLRPLSAADPFATADSPIIPADLARAKEKPPKPDPNFRPGRSRCLRGLLNTTETMATGRTAAGACRAPRSWRCGRDSREKPACLLTEHPTIAREEVKTAFSTRFAVR